MANKKKHIHFMGIGGSAMAGVAVLAKKAGFKVSGCDLTPETYYTKFLKKEKITPFLGHSKKHLKGVDILAISPAVFDLNNNHPEVIEAKNLMTWQKFMGKYLQKNKFVIAIAGTHGKSTTTALTGLVLEEAGLDPTVEVGAIVPEWKKTIRVGKSKFFVCEADEFNHNFLNYSPSIAIINNIEMDHPEFFKDFGEFQKAFRKFVKKLSGVKTLIVNEESRGIQKLLTKMSLWLKKNQIRLIGYYMDKRFKFSFSDEYHGKILNLSPGSSRFSVKSKSLDERFILKIAGRHNIQNALAVWALACELGIKSNAVKKTFKKFSGLGRRFSMVGERRGIKVFDDYSVHPTAIKATFQAAKQSYPKSRIWVVYEPHQYSRLNLFFNEFVKVLKLADKVVVTKPYEGREKGAKKPDMKKFVKEIGKKAVYLPDFSDVSKYVSQESKKRDVIIVAGAGKSYILSKEILHKLKS